MIDMKKLVATRAQPPDHARAEDADQHQRDIDQCIGPHHEGRTEPSHQPCGDDTPEAQCDQMSGQKQRRRALAYTGVLLDT